MHFLWNAPAIRGTTLCEKHRISNRVWKNAYRARNIEHEKERARTWYQRTKKLRVAVVKSRNQQIKREVFAAYGGICKCCGEDELVFLALDHVNNNGAAERRDKKGRNSGRALYLRLKKEGYPKTFQILCANCNWAKYVLGRCPHERSAISLCRAG